ncbi:MAG: PAS domain S-box protein [Bacteroidetes bacterium]|nr:MAG: PAS domain S-box protein [Bacteroidota bacterium]
MISFRNLRIRQKMLLLIMSITSIIYLLSFGYITLRMSEKAHRDAGEMANMQAREYANHMTHELNKDFNLSRGIGWALQNFPDYPLEMTEDIVSPVLYEFLDRNPGFYSTWVSLELNTLLPDYYLPYGRVRYTWLRQNGQLIFQRDTLNLEGDDEGSLYAQIKSQKAEAITNPYWYSYSGNVEDQILEVSPCIPIIINGHFAGLAGTDIILDRFQELVLSIKPFDVGYTYLLSNDGTYVGHPNPHFLGEKISEIRETYFHNFGLDKSIRQGEFISHFAFSENLDEEALITYAPIHIGDTSTPWSFAVVIPRSFITAEANHIFYRSLIVAVLGLLVLTWATFIIANNVTRPLMKTTAVISTIATGDINNIKELRVEGKDENAQMALSLNKLLSGLKATAGFAEKIGRGELSALFHKLGENDVLGTALLNMRDSLEKAKEEEEKRKAEDTIRNWATNGMARFADILRFNNDNLEELSFNVLKNLVKYLDANQGGLFVFNDEDKNEPFLEMTACYAYDRKKYITRKIAIGEGLTGACFLEKKPILMTDIPQDYVKITSGLGDENPNSLLIIPLLLNEKVYGVIELASFKKFEPYHVEFIEKVAENIASTLSAVKINIRTAYLLEQSQQQAEEMRAQEEEMRQNMEEMHATQEEMSRKDKELHSLVETSESLFCVMEYNKEGVILKVNHNFEKICGYTDSELSGKHHSILFDKANWEQSANYRKFWELLRRGQAVKGMLKRKHKEGTDFFIKGVTKAHLDENGQIEKVVEITIDITKEVSASEKSA